MKKIILGLFLTVGFTAFVSANTISDNYPNMESGITSKTDDNNISTDDDEILRKKECWAVEVTRVYDCIGNFKSIKSEGYEVDCGVNETGSIIFNVGYVDGCPQGRW